MDPGWKNYGRFYSGSICKDKFTEIMRIEKWKRQVQNLLQCLRNVICGEDVPLIAMSETEQEKLYQMSLAQDMAHLISAAVGNGENHII